MANLSIEWSIEGDKQLSRTLLGIKAGAKDLTEPFRTASTNLRRTFESDVFSSKGAVIGARWKPLRPATIREKARLGYPSDTLVRTGAMQRSFRTVVSTDQAVIYNTAEYFKYHQFNQARAKIPRRVMMRLAEAQKVMVVRVFQEHLRSLIQKFAFEP
jgi:phage gpG-like protein